MKQIYTHLFYYLVALSINATYRTINYDIGSFDMLIFVWHVNSKGNKSFYNVVIAMLPNIYLAFCFVIIFVLPSINKDRKTLILINKCFNKNEQLFYKQQQKCSNATLYIADFVWPLMRVYFIYSTSTLSPN